jgi:putative membrane protein
MHLLIRWLVNTLALFVVVKLLPEHFSYSSWTALAIAALVLGLLNAIVRPVLVFLTLPITVVTLGLFLIVVNALMLELTDFLVDGFAIGGFLWAIVGAVLLSIIGFFTSWIGRKND